MEGKDYYIEQADHYEAKAQAEQNESVKQAYRRLAANYRELASGEALLSRQPRS